MTERHILVHYHLRPGGVTTVLREQARVLTSLGASVQIISGEAAPPGADDFPTPIEVVPELGYRQHPLEPDDFERILHRLASIAGLDGILHFQNPTLKKNPSWMALINRLAASGHAILLQIHDFGEDHRWRPGHEPIDHARFYPCGDRVLWIVLHPEDRAILVSAGMADDDVAVLPNLVSAPVYGTLPSADDGKVRVLYPARGIRRKNIGEFLLLATLAPSSWEFRSTLPPNGAAQERQFRRWQRWAGHLEIKALLGEGTGDYRPDLVISTSVREGFGYSFAEPWLAGIPATGRHPDRWLVGHDGQTLPHAPGLYSAIHIPTRWLRKDTRPLVSGPTIDFADLPETGQRHVLREVVGDPDVAREDFLFELIDGRRVKAVDWFSGILAQSRDSIKTMAAHMRSGFSSFHLGERLRTVASGARGARGGLRGHADASMVLRAFSKPGPFRFLRLPPS
ncbi:MAG: hypothetical protein ACKO2G_13625 [Verrucomicrobiales bacterium]